MPLCYLGAQRCNRGRAIQMHKNAASMDRAVARRRQLRSGAQEGPGADRAPQAQGATQPSRELPPTDAAAGTGDAALQVARASAAFPGAVRADPGALLSRPASSGGAAA